MTPEHGSKSEENCNLRSAKAGHSSNICLSSPNASVLHKLQTRLAQSRLKWVKMCTYRDGPVNLFQKHSNIVAYLIAHHLCPSIESHQRIAMCRSWKA